MVKKIKLLVITHTFPTKNNPVAAIFLLNQLNELKKYCDIKVIFPYSYVPRIKLLNPYYRFSCIPSREKINGINVYHPKYLMVPRILFKLRFLNFYLSAESFFSYMSSKRMAKEIMAKWHPDIIHMHGQVNESLLGVHLKRRCNKPLVITLYGEDVNRFAKQFPSKYFSNFALSNSDAIICQSIFLENEVKKLGLQLKRLFVIPMGALLDKFKPRNKNKSRKILSLPLDKKIILFVGHLFERKGVEYLIRAMGILKEKDKNILCCIIGSGYLEKNLKKISQELGLGNHIIFLGPEKRGNIPVYMNACDVFALPSLSEGLPVVLCEALASGKPVVATRASGTPELVSKDVGYLINPRDFEDLAGKIVLALHKKWDKNRLRKRAKGFSTANSAKKVLNVYKSLLE